MSAAPGRKGTGMIADFSMHGGAGCFAVEGELDLASTLVLRHVLDAAIDVQELDLAALRFVDSTGLRALVHARAAHPRLRFVNVSSRARRAAALAGLTDLLFLDDLEPPARAVGG